MATKTITLELDAYEKLRQAKKGGESFTEVVRRAVWLDAQTTEETLLRYYRNGGSGISGKYLDSAEEAARHDRIPDDPWGRFSIPTSSSSPNRKPGAGELARGQSASPKHDWERLCRPYPILPWSSDISRQYGELYRVLASQGQLIGTNDLWIAPTALVHGMDVVTNNVAEFNRVPGLTVVPY